MIIHELPVTRHMMPDAEPARIERDDGGLYGIVVECPECRKTLTKMLSPDEVDKVIDYYDGKAVLHVQDMFPKWTPAERETFLMSHICNRCWYGLTSEPEEGENE